MSLRYRLPSPEDIRQVKELLSKFRSDEPIDDAEELLEDIPVWLEWIVALWEERGEWR